MKNLSLSRSIILALVSAGVLALAIFVLMPHTVVVATVVATIAALAFIKAANDIVKHIVAAIKANRAKNKALVNVGDYAIFANAKRSGSTFNTAVILILIAILIAILAHGCGSENRDLYVENAYMQNANMENADMENTNMKNTNIGNADIGNANIGNADIGNADIGNADIGNANIGNADIGNANIGNANIENANIVTTNGNSNNACNNSKPAETPKPAPTKPVETPKVETPTHVCAVAKTVVEEATCTKDGYVRKVCECGAIISQDVIKATGHVFNGWQVTTKATENTYGVKTRTCKKCDYSETDKVEKLEHKCVFVTEKEEATCTKDGYIREVCDCGKVRSEDVIEATGHNWNKGKVTKEATEKTTGIKTYTCKTCGRTETEVLEKIVHECEVFDEIEKEATCTKDGYIREICSCGEIISEKPLKATGHDYKEVDRKEATATEDGYIKYRCSNCGDSDEDVIPATGEDEESVERVFEISVPITEVVGNEFAEIRCSATVNVKEELEFNQGGATIFTITYIDDHNFILTVGDYDTFGSLQIYNEAHQDKAVEVIRRADTDPMA